MPWCFFGVGGVCWWWGGGVCLGGEVERGGGNWGDKERYTVYYIMHTLHTHHVHITYTSCTHCIHIMYTSCTHIQTHTHIHTHTHTYFPSCGSSNSPLSSVVHSAREFSTTPTGLSNLGDVWVGGGWGVCIQMVGCIQMVRVHTDGVHIH